MTETTYTMFVAGDAGGHKIVARKVTAERALTIALDHGRAVRSMITCWAGRTHRLYEIARRLPDERRELVMAVKVPRSSDEFADACMAADAFVDMLLSDPRRFWGGEIEPDETFLRQHEAGSA